MTLIVWREDFETGIAEVDHEHRQLVRLINDLHEHMAGAATRESVAAFLGEVFARVAAHFALEESVMRKHRYDEYAAHKSEHEQLLDRIRDIMDDHESGRYADYDDALATAVRDWFVVHFKTRDARLHKALGV